MLHFKTIVIWQVIATYIMQETINHYLLRIDIV